MPSEMAIAQADLIASLKTEAGETVTYRRGAHSVSITAVAGRKSRTLLLDEGVNLAFDELEWKIAVADLILNGSETLPERGDEITRTVGAATHKYVVRTEGSMPCYYVDPNGTCLTVSSKLEARS